MSHASLQDLLEAEPSIPVQQVCLQLHPYNALFSSVSTITSELVRVSRVTASIGGDMLLDKHRQCFCVYQSARSSALMTLHIGSPLDCCAANKANEVLLLAKGGAKRLNVRSGELQDIAIDNRGAVQPTMLRLAFSSRHGFATDGSTYIAVSLRTHDCGCSQLSLQ